MRAVMHRHMRVGRAIIRVFALAVVWPALAAGQAAPASAAVPDCTQPTGGDPNRPYPVCDVSPAITHGPYLLAPTDTSATIVWTTDLPSHARVLYGTDSTLDREAVPLRDGMTPVGRLHTVRLTGLRPGQTYRYRVAATPVLELNTYWPKKGRELQSETYAFTTLDGAKPTASFVTITDTHERVPRIDSLMRAVDWRATDALVHTGDAFDGVTSEDEIWERWLDPIIAGGIGPSTPFVFARGNHDTRGPFARELARYVPVEEGRFYYTRDLGPVHLLVLDTGEDKPDSTQVYAGLNGMERYRAEELAWLRRHVRESTRLREAPFRVIVMHQPDWGWLSGDEDAARAAWTAVANEAKVDLVIAGHEHRFSIKPPGGPLGNHYPILVVGQGQLAKVRATETELHVTVVGSDGVVVRELTIPRATP